MWFKVSCVVGEVLSLFWMWLRVCRVVGKVLNLCSGCDLECVALCVSLESLKLLVLFDAASVF